MSEPVLSQSAYSNAFVPEFEQRVAENLTTKIATTAEEIAAAQKLRYQVFYKEMGAHPTEAMSNSEQEFDPYDDFCDHLLVIDNDGDKIVGTYRILQMDKAIAQNVPFVTESEYDLTKLKATGKKIVEVSRSCVLKKYRSKHVINMLWRGIAEYVFSRDVDYLIGTPSFPGTDVSVHAHSLGYLNAFYAADETIRPRTIENAYVPLPVVDKSKFNARQEFMKLPPLLKGYLRLGAVIADGAFIDHQFNVIDIAIVVDLKNITDRYLKHFKPDNV